ncbi:MAG: murein L,D-transpeptidase, partial [Bradyrhizobium sp.]
MRDRLKNRSGFDRVLMAVAATFVAVSAVSVSAFSALAQTDLARGSAAELAIEAAIPLPEPANLPPPTVNDFKPVAATPVATTPVATAPAPDTTNTSVQAPETKPSDFVTAPVDEPNKGGAAKNDTATTTPAAATPGAEPASEPTKAASNVPPADQPVADSLREMLGAKSLRYFDRKTERSAVEKFYTAREFAPLWTQSGALTQGGKGVIARLKDAGSDGLISSDYPVPDFAAANTPDLLAEADLKLTASMLDYARQAQSGRMHWSQVSADIQYPEHPTDPSEVLESITTAKDASAALAGYNPPQKLYRELKAKLAELRGQGDGPAVQIAEGPALRYTPARGKRQPATEM